ncbi:unnamed protein product [Closterium sp. Yama58-4]|nr:unnamed protein product [Closterium sp. Yama58-4]
MTTIMTVRALATMMKATMIIVFPLPHPLPPPPPPAPPSAPPPSTPPPGPGVATKFSCPPTPEMCSFVFEGYETELPTITLPALSTTTAASKQAFRPKTAYDANLEPGTLVALLRGSTLDLSDTVADMSRIMCLGGKKKNATLPRFTFKLTPDGHLRYDDTRVSGDMAWLAAAQTAEGAVVNEVSHSRRVWPAYACQGKQPASEFPQQEKLRAVQSEVCGGCYGDEAEMAMRELWSGEMQEVQISSSACGLWSYRLPARLSLVCLLAVRGPAFGPARQKSLLSVRAPGGENGVAASERCGGSNKRDRRSPAPAAAGSAMTPELTPDGATAVLGTAASQENAEECAAVLARLGRSADSLPPDLADAIARGRVPGEVVERYAEMENTVVLGYLLRFGGFKERLLADDLFMTKVAIECGIGICTKTSAELERRRAAFFPEFDFVIADVIMALIADFMLVWLPAPTIPLHPALAKEATALQKFLDTCPDNAFQVPVRGTEYTLLQRFTAVLRNGAKLMVVGTTASLFGCGMTNALQWVRRVLAAPPAAAAATVPSLDLTAASFPLDSSAELAATLNPAAAIDAATTAALVLDPAVAADVAAAVSASAADVAAALATAAEVATSAAGTMPPDLEVPILATSLAYGSYAAISANLRYQILAGVIEQQWLEPRFHGNKTLLSVLSFIFRTSNTFIGSLLWVDYARWIGSLPGQGKKVCVTGASGFIGSYLVKLLLDRGYNVRGTVRDATNEDKTSWIRDLAEGTPGKLELFSADLGKPGSFDEAVEGCDYVCHVASLVRMSVPNPQTVVDAALEGTRNVFSSIIKHKTAKKVVVTSSVAAIIDYINKDHVFTEEDWNRDLTLKDPYPMGKTLAEKYAWKTAEDLKGQDWSFELVTICPAMVYGKAIRKAHVRTSLDVIRQLMDGWLFMAPDLYFGIVHVDDVVLAHALALEKDTAKGRYILCNGDTLSMLEMAAVIKKNYPNAKTPTYTMPNALAYLVSLAIPGVSFEMLVLTANRKILFVQTP